MMAQEGKGGEQRIPSRCAEKVTTATEYLEVLRWTTHALQYS